MPNENPEEPVSTSSPDALEGPHLTRVLPMRDAFICDFARTPIGRYGGALASVRTDDLAAHPLRVLKDRNGGVDWNAVDEVIYGCANQAGEDNRNVARMAALLAGLPTGVPTTINRLGSGSMRSAPRRAPSGPERPISSRRRRRDDVLGAPSSWARPPRRSSARPRCTTRRSAGAS